MPVLFYKAGISMCSLVAIGLPEDQVGQRVGRRGTVGIKSVIYRYFKGAETDVGLFEVYLCLSSIQSVSSVLSREELWQKTRKERGGKWCP